jgi:hypothetical protein
MEWLSDLGKQTGAALDDTGKAIGLCGRTVYERHLEILSLAYLHSATFSDSLDACR